MFSTIKQHMSFANMDHVVDEADATQQRMHVLKALAHFFNDMGFVHSALYSQFPVVRLDADSL